jgi:NADPH:quinone reductase-like Zn-dependent oxidoreductase
LKAIVYERHGGPEVLEYNEVSRPKPGATDALLRVRSCALNQLDIFLRNVRWDRRLTDANGELAGDVEQVGELVTNVKPGDRAVIAPFICCGSCENCLAGNETTCLKGDVLGRFSNGGYAEYVVAPAHQFIRIPDSVSYDAAAANTLATVTAWHMLVTRARMRPGEVVLVLAAGSGVGSAAIQIAKLGGARVFATASTPEKLEKARALGADVLINHAETNFQAEVRRLTNKRGVDIVIEHVGEATWEQSVGSLARNGRLVTTGATTGPHGAIDINRLFGAQLSIFGSFGGTRAELRTVLEMVSQGRIRPVIHAIYPLREAAEAQRVMEDRAQFGKILLNP